jgi:AAA15 family ATPase/GTPase
MFFIDEIDSSIHPDLLEFFLKTFLVNAKESQLLISTHHREWLMQNGFVRPDSVWFTEKHSDGSTHLYSLADFSDINSFNRSFTYYDAYRRGVLGAKPSYRYYYLDTKDNEI